MWRWASSKSALKRSATGVGTVTSRHVWHCPQRRSIQTSSPSARGSHSTGHTKDARQRGQTCKPETGHGERGAAANAARSVEADTFRRRWNRRPSMDASTLSRCRLEGKDACSCDEASAHTPLGGARTMQVCTLAKCGACAIARRSVDGDAVAVSNRQEDDMVLAAEAEFNSVRNPTNGAL
jgi:hypothetical protein